MPRTATPTLIQRNQPTEKKKKEAAELGITAEEKKKIINKSTHTGSCRLDHPKRAA